MNKTHDFKLNMPDYSDVVDIDILNDNFRVIDDALMAGLCEKEYTGNNMGSSDPASRKYAWAPWFEIKNENDFDVQITDRNFETTITIEAGETYRKHIVGTYYMNFYVQDQHDVTFRWFCDAETRIKEIDPSGGGSVSSVNVTGASSSHIVTSGGPITSSGTIEIDLAEGYSIPQTNKQTSWDGKAADLKAEIDSSTYVLTLQLKDSAGNLIGNERTIDLPLETMVVDGEYDPQTQKIKLELKNGNYVEFSVADLVSGLQTELSASNKLDPDYIDYDASHRAVSDTEKDTWNGKQNAISDLETIRSGAAAGATAVQPSVMEDALDDKQDSIDGSHKLSSDLVDDTNKTNKFVTSAEKNTWNSKQNALTFDDAPTSGSNNPVKSGGIYTALSGKQDTIDSSHKLSSALVSFSTAQNAALSSGIDSTKVSQISTNQTNILYTLNRTGKNLLDTPSVTISTRTWNTDSDGYITASDTTGDARALNYDNCQYYCHLRSGTYKLVVDIKTASSNGSAIAAIYSKTGTISTNNLQNKTGVQVYEFTISTEDDYGVLTKLYAGSWRMMICEADMYAKDSSYVPYSLPNYDLTRLEAEDRAALAEEIDAGAKNKLSAQLTSNTVGHKEATWTFMTDCVGATVNGTVGVTWDDAYVFDKELTFNDQEYILVIQTSNNNLIATLFGNTSPDAPSGGQYTAGVYRFKGKITTTSRLSAKSGTYSNDTIKLMICTKAAFGVSNKFVPYRPSWDIIADSIKTVQIATSDFITVNTNFTILSQSTLFKHGSQVFGTLVIQKTDTAKFVDSLAAVGTIKSGYRPVVNLIGQSYYNTEQWGVNGFGYSYINTSGTVSVKSSTDSANKYSYVAIPINYMTA